MAYSIFSESQDNYYVAQLSIVCFDVNLTDKDMRRLSTVIPSIAMFLDADECVDFVTNIGNEKVFLILSDSSCLGFDVVVPVLHDFPQVHAIYVLREDRSRCAYYDYCPCARDKPKIQEVCTDLASLYQAVREGARHWERKKLHINICSKDPLPEPKEKGPNRQEATFMLGLLFKEILVRMNEDEPAEMIMFCRSRFADNPHVLAAIEELNREYRMHTPVWWYTKPVFLYEMLNRALREFDVETLFALRMFIVHLEKQLVHLRNSRPKSSCILYRGQQIPTIQFERLKNNVGGLLSINQFFSTTTDRSLALIFAGRSSSTMEALIFHIEVNSSDTTNSFADISSVSFFADTENEHLFSMGCVFRIGLIEQEPCTGIWVIQLSMADSHDSELHNLMEYFRDGIFRCENPLMQLGRLLFLANESEKAEIFYLKALEDRTNCELPSDILNSLGTTWLKRDPVRALNYLQQALVSVQSCLAIGSCYRLYASILNNMSVVYAELGELDLALACAKESLENEFRFSSKDFERIHNKLQNVGGILLKQKKYDESEHYLRQALDYAVKVLPHIHPGFINLYENLAHCLIKNGQLLEAYEFQQKAMDICLHSLSPNNQRFQQCKYNLRLVKEHIDLFREPRLNGCILVNLDDGTWMCHKKTD